MADGHRGDPALGLGRLAGIADNERIEHRKRAQDQFRKAGGRERDRLAGQPFRRAVGAHVHDRIDLGAVPQPQAEGQERMARRQCRVVVFGAARRRAPAVRRQRDDHVAAWDGAKPERTVPDIRIVIRVAPGRADPRGSFRRQIRQPIQVGRDREACNLRRCDLFSLPVFGEGRGGVLSTAPRLFKRSRLVHEGDPTRPRFVRPPSPKTGRDIRRVSGVRQRGEAV